MRQAIIQVCKLWLELAVLRLQRILKRCYHKLYIIFINLSVHRIKEGCCTPCWTISKESNFIMAMRSSEIVGNAFSSASLSLGDSFSLLPSLVLTVVLYKELIYSFGGQDIVHVGVFYWGGALLNSIAQPGLHMILPFWSPLTGALKQHFRWVMCKTSFAVRVRESKFILTAFNLLSRDNLSILIPRQKLLCHWWIHLLHGKFPRIEMVILEQPFYRQQPLLSKINLIK